MILSDIGAYVKQRGRVSLEDVALHFDAEPDAVRGMLEVWIRKGKISKSRLGTSCGAGCDQCKPATTEIYVWGGSADGSGSPPVCDAPNN